MHQIVQMKKKHLQQTTNNPSKALPKRCEKRYEPKNGVGTVRSSRRKIEAGAETTIKSKNNKKHRHSHSHSHTHAATVKWQKQQNYLPFIYSVSLLLARSVHTRTVDLYCRIGIKYSKYAPERVCMCVWGMRMCVQECCCYCPYSWHGTCNINELKNARRKSDKDSKSAVQHVSLFL